MVFSWLFRGPCFGQILRVLALEQSSDDVEFDLKFEISDGKNLVKLGENFSTCRESTGKFGENFGANFAANFSENFGNFVSNFATFFAEISFSRRVVLTKWAHS